MISFAKEVDVHLIDDAGTATNNNTHTHTTMMRPSRFRANTVILIIGEKKKELCYRFVRKDVVPWRIR